MIWGNIIYRIPFLRQSFLFIQANRLQLLSDRRIVDVLLSSTVIFTAHPLLILLTERLAFSQYITAQDVLPLISTKDITNIFINLPLSLVNSVIQ